MTLVCVECGDDLTRTGAGFVCGGCSRAFDVIAGIPDLRPDVSGADAEADRHLAIDLDAAARRADFGELLRRLWRAHPEVPATAAEQFVLGDLSAAERSERVIGQICHTVGRTHHGAVALEIGCGTAALGTALAARMQKVVASDVSLSWLVLARHRAAQARLGNVRFVACSADRLPFRENTFDLVVGADVIEHVSDTTALAASAYRVLRPEGALWLSTPNRFSLTPEPHVGLWGVGYLPRPLAQAYVRRFRGVAYEAIRPVTWRGLADILAATGSTDITVVAPAIVKPLRSDYGRVGRTLIEAYNIIRDLPVGERVLRPIAPLFHASARKPVDTRRDGAGPRSDPVQHGRYEGRAETDQ